MAQPEGQMSLSDWRRTKEGPSRSAEWRAQNRERHREYSRRWSREHPKEAAARSAAWEAANVDRVRERRRAWRTANRDRRLVLGREDARKRYLGRDSDAYEYSLTLRRDPCSYCGQPSSVVDHIDPLSQGGANEWDNLTAACLSCNSSKRDKPLLVWLAGR
jgi:5-methylcytosine-specific restriction endonuclease McrA